MVLDVTISGKTTNSYVDMAFADSYFLNHYDLDKAVAWAGLTTLKKTTALIQATRILETVKCTDIVLSSLEYVPTYNKLTGYVQFMFEDKSKTVKRYYNQKLQFPRNVDIDDTGTAFIPEEVKMAQCEQAIYLLDFDTEDIAATLSGAEFKATTVGQISLRTQYKSGASSLAPLAYEFLKPYILLGSTRVKRA